jgi:pantetheine-phosphate adenylyltransferase
MNARKDEAGMPNASNDHPEDEAGMLPRNGGTGVCPGSYDPVTLGHLDIIGRAAAVFDNVVVAVVAQAVRKQKTLFSAEERIGFLEAEVQELGNVQVKPFDTLLVDFAREHGARAIVKGLRAISDFEYEFEMTQLNRKMAPDIESVYLMSSPEYSFLSSSGVKEVAMFGGDLTGLVPGAVGKRLQEALRR